MITTYRAQQGQSIYDVCAQTYGTMEQLTKLMTDNGIDNYDQDCNQILFSYDTDLVDNGALNNYNANNGIIYATPYKIPTENVRVKPPIRVVSANVLQGSLTWVRTNVSQGNILSNPIILKPIPSNG